MTDVIEYVHRVTLNMTNLNTVHKRRSRLYHIVENDFIHINLTLQKTTKNSLSRAGFELASHRCSLQCQINMNLVFHISEDGSEIERLCYDSYDQTKTRLNAFSVVDILKCVNVVIIGCDSYTYRECLGEE